MLLPKDAAGRVYCLVTVLVTLLTLYFCYQEAVSLENQLLLEKKLALNSIANTLEQRLPESFTAVLNENGASLFPTDDQRLVLNWRLQGIVAEVANEWPGYSMGYYSPDLKVIAGYSPDMKNFPLGKEATAEALRIYETGQTQFTYLESGFTHDGDPILAINYPLYRNGKLIGHAWANIKTRDIQLAVRRTLAKDIGVTVALWIVVMVFIGLGFQGLRRSLANLVNYFEKEEGPPPDFTLFPGAASVIEMIDGLRKKLQEEYDDKLQVQEELARMDRLKLIGEMAAGVAHEVRNPMTVAKGYLQIMARNNPGVASKVQVVFEELNRVEMLITDFLSLARNKPTEYSKADLNTILDRVYPLIYASAMKKNIKIDVYPSALPELYLNEKEITQVLLNLARNSIEATDVGGKVEIRTKIADNRVLLEVVDTGEGIPQDLVPKIFDPFFTTKSNGTGLGLSICASIVERHGGKISVDSVVGQGTNFSVELPLSQKK